MLRTKFNSIILLVFGDKEQIDTERYFLTITCFSASLFLMLLCVFHISENLKLAPVILAGSSSLVILGLYFFIRFGTCLYIPKVILSVLGLLMLDLTWYFKYLSNGPVLFFILIFGALLLWVWEGKCLAILLTIYFLNLAVLFVIDFNAPDLLFRYPDVKTRTIDIYLSFLLYSSLLIFLLYMIKKEFIRQKVKAIRSDKLKSAFLANMSHEIRTPMNTIVGFSQLIKDNTDYVKMHQYVNIIKSSSDTLLKLIDDIIDLSKIEAGDMHLSYSGFSIKEMFIELKDIYSIELLRREKGDVKFEYYLPDGDIIVFSDPFRVRQVLSNLLSNALKFTMSGTITLNCEKRNGELLLSVSDTGTGIPEEDHAKIFERFTKFNYQGRNEEGSGIGLSIVEKIVAILNGRIWLTSVMGEGTSFYISIPFISPIFTSNSYIKPQKIMVSDKLGSRKTILVVEDDKTSFLLIKEILSKLDLEIHNVTDGKDAIDFIKLNPATDLILMDLKLPVIDGYKAAFEIRSINPDIPIIAQTAFAMLGDREKAIAAGCNEYITKPLDSKKFQELVKAYLSNQN
jgi:signal transduction histidine kinase/ActR/RegA family two-component response regulator